LISYNQLQIKLLKFDTELENGPIRQRWITDIFCCVFFAFFIGVMLAIAGYGFSIGDPRLLLIGWDSDLNGCGYSEATKDYPYLYWP